jgi:predicted secreted protein
MGTPVKSRLAKLAISPDNGVGSYVDVSNIQSIKLGGKRATYKRTTKDTGDGEEHAAGRRDTTMSADGLYIEDDAGQEAVRTAYENGTTVWFRYRPDTGGGKKQFRCQGIVTGMDDDSPDGDADDSLSISIQLTGTPVREAQ